MKTFTTAALLSVLSVALALPAEGQTRPTPAPPGLTPGLPRPTYGPSTPAREPGAPASAPALPAPISFECDLAWNPAYLTVTDEDIKGFIEGYRPENINSRWRKYDLVRFDIAFKEIPLSEARATRPPVPATMPADPKGWKAGRFSMIIIIERWNVTPALPRRGDGDIGTSDVYITPQEVGVLRTEMPEWFRSALQHWLSGLDRTQGKSKAIYEVFDRGASSAVKAYNEASAAYQEYRGRRNSLKMDYVAKDKRLAAINAKIRELKAESKDRIADDPVVKELQEIVKLREAALDKTQKIVDEGLKSKTIAPAEGEALVRDAQLKLIEARVQLAQRREAVAGPAVGELLSRLVNEQTTTEIDIAEIQARLQAIQDMASTVEQLDQSVKDINKKREEARVYRVLDCTLKAPS